MRISPVMRGARAYALATLVFSLGLSPSYARMGGSVGRPAFGGGHFTHSAPGGFNRRFEAGRFGFNRFGPNRFDRFGFNRFNRFGANQLFVGGWGGWGGYSAPAPSQRLIVGDSAPVIINISLDPGQAPPPAPRAEAASSTSSITTATANMSASVRSRSADRLGG